MDTVLWLCPPLPTKTLKFLSSLPILMQKSFWWWQCSDRYIISLSPTSITPSSPFSPSLISRTVSVDVKHHVYLLYQHRSMVQCTFSETTRRLVKPVLNWTNVCSPEHTSDTSTNYDSFLNWTFSSPNMVRTVQTLLHSQLACNEMQASARTCGRRAADSMIENVG